MALARLQGRSLYVSSLGKALARYGGVDGLVRACHEAGLSAIWLRLGFGARLDPNLKRADFGQLRDALRATGVSIWGWLLTQGETRKTKRVRLSTDFLSSRLAGHASFLAGLRPSDK